MLEGRSEARLRRATIIMAANCAVATTMWPTGLSAQILLNPADVTGAAAHDYPLNAFKNGAEGTTRYNLSLGADGHPTSCEVTGSSGNDELDAQTCMLLPQKAKFYMSGVSPKWLNPIFEGQFIWAIPLSSPRALQMGVTVKSSSPFKNMIRCEYSDGLVRYVQVDHSCGMKIPSVQKINEITNEIVHIDIFEQYFSEIIIKNNMESSFNVGVILLDNGYKEGILYLDNTAKEGNLIAKQILCSIYDVKSEKTIINFENNIKKDREKTELYCNNGELINKNVTKKAQMLTLGNAVIRPKDYPSQATSVGGITKAALEISEIGKVKSCLIIQSTYSHLLDQKVCSRFKTAADFIPAEIDGKPSSHWMTQNVRWVAAPKFSFKSAILGFVLGFIAGSAN